MVNGGLDHAKMVLDLSRPEVTDDQALHVLAGIPGKLATMECPETRSRLMVVVLHVAQKRSLSLPVALVGDLLRAAVRDSNERVFLDFEATFAAQAKNGHRSELFDLVNQEFERLVVLYESEGGSAYKQEAERERRKRSRTERRTARYKALCKTVAHLTALEVRAARLRRLRARR